MFSPLADQIVPARNFYHGREQPVLHVVLHTTEGPSEAGSARMVALWFAGQQAPEASAHYVIDPGETIGAVDEDDRAWHVGAPANHFTIGIELCANSADVRRGGTLILPAFTAEDWEREDVVAMLDRAAALVADICARHLLPLVFVPAEGLVRQERGITTHAEVSRAWKGTTHTDPGVLFPMEDFIARVRAAARPLGAEQRIA